MTQTAKKTIWVVADDRAGNTAQSLGVAEVTGMDVVIKNIRYTPFVRLPNFLRGKSLLGLTKESEKVLSPPFPDYAVAAGRRAAPALRWIKKQSNGKTKIVQIMFPGAFGLSDFDLVVLPEHDGYRGTAPNIMRVAGAPNRVTDKRLETEREHWRDAFKTLSSPKIAVIVGGKTKDRPFTVADATRLADAIDALARKTEASLMITTSRRTGDEQENVLKTRFPDAFFYSWKDAGAENPYFGFLACADMLIVTGDSVSMCSEACSTGKPVYIFAPETLCSKKHRLLHQRLYDGGYAAPLSEAEIPARTERPRLHVAADIAERMKNV